MIHLTGNVEHVAIETNHDGQWTITLRTLSSHVPMILNGPACLMQPMACALTDYMAALNSAAGYDETDCDDDDDGHALASAGFGTDEDYGGHMQ